MLVCSVDFCDWPNWKRIGGSLGKSELALISKKREGDERKRRKMGKEIEGKD